MANAIFLVVVWKNLCFNSYFIVKILKNTFNGGVESSGLDHK